MDLSRTKLDVIRTFMENFTVQICWKYIQIKKLVPHNCSKKPISLNWMIFAFWMKLAKHNYPSTQAAYKSVSDESTYTPRNLVFSTCSTFLSSINSSLLNVIFCFLFLNIMKCVFSIFSDSLFVLSHSIILDISSFMLVTSLSGSFPDIKMLESSAKNIEKAFEDT